MLVDIILILSYLALAAAFVVTLWAIWHTLRKTTRQGGYVHGIPTRKIGVGLIAGLVVLLLLTFVLGGSDAVHINGAEYNDAFVLKSSDMLINTSLVLMIVAGGCALYSFYREAKQMDKDANIFIDLFKPRKKNKKFKAVKVVNTTKTANSDNNNEVEQ